MAITAESTSNDLRRSAVSLVCLIAGVLFGLISVYSNSRTACACWVALALVLTFVSGLLAARGRTRR
jgi:hypothetical protein